MKVLYRITVLDFNKTNAKIKPSYKATLIANNFCHDSRLSVLPLSHRWLFLGIQLACGDHASDTVELNERQVRDLLLSSKSIESALLALKQIQVLTYERVEIPTSLKEIKERENKEKEEKETAAEGAPPPAADFSPPEEKPSPPADTTNNATPPADLGAVLGELCAGEDEDFVFAVGLIPISVQTSFYYRYRTKELKNTIRNFTHHEKAKAPTQDLSKVLNLSEKLLKWVKREQNLPENPGWQKKMTAAVTNFGVGGA